MTNNNSGSGESLPYHFLGSFRRLRYCGIVVVLLVLCVGISAGLPVYTASFSPANGVINQNSQITLTVNNIHHNDIFKISSTGTGLHLTTSSYSLKSVYVPFNLSGSSVYASDANSDNLFLSLEDPNGNTKYYGPSFPVNSLKIPSGTYPYITLTGPSSLSGQTTNVNLYIQGTVSDSASPATTNLQFILGGVDQGTITFEVSDGTSTLATATYSIYVPPNPGPDSGDAGGPAGPAAQLGPVQQVQPVGVPQLAPSQALVSVQTPVTGTGQLTSGPITASPEGMPNIQVSWTTTVTTTPPAGASIQTSVLGTLDEATLAQYQSYLADIHETYNGLAYAVVVEKTGITSTGPATLSMMVPIDWLINQGGINSIAVIHTGDDGNMEFLTPSVTFMDPVTGMATLSVFSPNGLSTFSLVSVRQQGAVASQTTSPVAAGPSETFVSNGTPGAMTTKTPLPVSVTIVSVCLGIAACGIYRKIKN